MFLVPEILLLAALVPKNDTRFFLVPESGIGFWYVCHGQDPTFVTALEKPRFIQKKVFRFLGFLGF